MILQYKQTIIHETYDADSAWSVGGLIKSDEWTADDLTIQELMSGIELIFLIQKN